MRAPLVLLLACGAYLALRILILVTHFDAVAMPIYELATIGNLAEATSTHSRAAPLSNFYDNCGGQLMTGLAAAPLYALFGDSYLVLKLVPLSLGLVAMGAIWFILTRWWGRTAAIVAVWCFALPPPTLLKYSMLAKGNHFENLPLQLTVFALFLRAQTAEHRSRWLFATGLAAGVAVFVYFGSLVLIAALCLTGVAMVGRRRAFSDALRVAAGFAIGIAPLVWIEMASRGRASHFLRAKFGAAPSPDSMFERAWDLLAHLLPRAGVFESVGPISGRVAECAFFAVFAIAWIQLVAWIVRSRSSEPSSRFERFKSAPLALYLPIFVANFAISDFDFDAYNAPVEVGQFRYLVPHFALACLIFGVVCARLWSFGGARRVLGATIATVVLAVGLTDFAIVDWKFAETDAIAKYRGYWFHYYADVALELDPKSTPNHPGWNNARIGENLAGLSSDLEHAAWEGVGHRLAQAAIGARDFVLDEATLANLLAPFDAAHGIDLARGIGSCFRRYVTPNEAMTRRLKRTLDALAISKHPLAPYVVEGMCVEFGYPLELSTFDELERSRRLGVLVPSSLREAWLRGQGLAFGRSMARGTRRDIAIGLECAAELAQPDRPMFWFGVGWGLGDTARAELPTDDVTTWAGGADLRALYIGFGAAWVHSNRSADRIAYWDRISPKLDKERQIGLQFGLRWSDYPKPIRL